MIFNIELGTFGGPVRNGDLIGVANVVQFLRNRNNNPTIKFHMKQESINSAEYVQQFYSFLLRHTDYFSDEPGEKSLSWSKVNVWDFRDLSGDLVSIPNEMETKRKIVVFPVLDAQYNTYRNWPLPIFQQILANFETEEYEGYEKIICVQGNQKYREGWTHSHDFMTNIYHIMDAQIFIGGDTGTSHFAWALDRSPQELIYYSSSRELLHTLPFYSLRGKGKINTYWLDFEGSNFSQF
jgi:hypothetical protein